jgi:hypothetical protein
MVAVLRIVPLVVTDNPLVATDGCFRVRLIVVERSGSGKDIVMVSVMTGLARWNDATGGGNSTTVRRHRLGVMTIHLVSCRGRKKMLRRRNAKELAEKIAAMDGGII